MDKKYDASSDKKYHKLGVRLMPYSTLGIILLVMLAIAEYLFLFLTMRPIRMLIF